MLHHLIIPAKFLSFMKRAGNPVLQLDYMYKRTVEMYISKRISFFINTPNDVYIYVSGVTDF